MYKDITSSIEEKVGFDLTNIEVSTIVNVPSIVSTVTEIKDESKNYKNVDYNFARNNLHTLLEKSMSAIDVVISLVKESESPRAIEAASTFIKCLSDLNKDLVSLNDNSTSKNDKNDKNVDNTSNNSSITNNAIFIGSSDELSDIIKNKIIDMESK